MTIVIDIIAQDGFRFTIAHTNAQQKRNPKTENIEIITISEVSKSFVASVVEISIAPDEVDIQSVAPSVISIVVSPVILEFAGAVVVVAVVVVAVVVVVVVVVAVVVVAVVVVAVVVVAVVLVAVIVVAVVLVTALVVVVLIDAVVVALAITVDGSVVFVVSAVVFVPTLR